MLLYNSKHKEVTKVSETNKLKYIMPSQPTEKPVGDMSIITDYDQRYLNIISKIFNKQMSVDDLNDVLDTGGNIAAYWHKNRLVGAVVWTWDNAEGGEIKYIGFKKRVRGKGFAKKLLNYAIYTTTTKDNHIGDLPLTVSLPEDDPNTNFFTKYGFKR